MRPDLAAVMGSMQRVVLIATVGALSAAALPSAAHHSYGMFDLSKEVSIAGTVKEFQWGNPHIFIQVVAPGEDGKPTEYSVEGTSPGVLRRAGWTFNSLKAGDRVTVVMSPLRDTSRIGGMLQRVTTADGRVLSNKATDTAPVKAQ